jgi:hypothetical protein
MTNAFQITHGGKPYICSVCDEGRDAHDSPPTTGLSGDLICEDCYSVPASRIMRERNDYKERWAKELTRAEAAERKLAELAGKSTTIEDLTDHCDSQGRYIADLQADVAFWKDSSETWANLREAADEQVRGLEQQVEHWKACHADLYAKWYALQGTPYGQRAVIAEAALINRDKLIAELRAELADMRGALDEYETADEEASR